MFNAMGHLVYYMIEGRDQGHKSIKPLTVKTAYKIFKVKFELLRNVRICFKAFLGYDQNSYGNKFGHDLLA